MSAHTPGPWVWGRDLGSFWIETEKDGYSVASVNNHNMKAENEANARLIAAAPELLNELRELAELAHNAIDVPDSVWAAIAKATGAA